MGNNEYKCAVCGKGLVDLQSQKTEKFIELVNNAFGVTMDIKVYCRECKIEKDRIDKENYDKFRYI